MFTIYNFLDFDFLDSVHLGSLSAIRGIKKKKQQRGEGDERGAAGRKRASGAEPGLMKPS